MKKILEWIMAVALIVFIYICCFLPTIIFCMIYFLTKPQGFWEKFAIGVVGVWFLATFQFIGIIGALAFTLYLMEGKKC